MPEGTRSIWMDEAPRPAARLAGNTQADVVVIGAGIAGMTAAYLLAKAGRDVIVLDRAGPGQGMTGRTTAHVATALDDRWTNLIARRSEEDAQIAADAYVQCIDLIESIQQTEGIACDFARIDGYLVLGADDTKTTLEKEIDATRKINLAGVDWAQSCPFIHLGAGPCLRFPRQARFHPMKYLSGLADCIRKHGGRILTAHVTSVNDGDPVCVETADGATVRAECAVVATNSPINDRVIIHTKQAPYRTYVVAASVPKNSVPDILCWDTETPYHYARLQPGEDSDTLIIGGEDHKTGQANDGAARFARLEAWARARFPAIAAFTARWSGQVMESADYLGYMGRNPGDENVFVITGDSGMGMSHGTIGAVICAELIQGRKNPWAELFDPSRVSPKAAGRFARENLNVAAQFREYLTSGDVQDAAAISPGSGAVIRRGASKYAVYRRPDGSLVERSAVCTHMGCIVAWNAVESCWDCPCHGSQFAAEGEAINGPATGGLGVPEQRTQAAHEHNESHTHR